MATRSTPGPSRFRRWRASEGYTLQDVGDLTGLSIAHLSRVERGECGIAPQTKVMVARRLGVRVADLFDVEPVEEAS